MSEIRVWLRHFDPGPVLPVHVGNDRAIGLGISPGDSYYDQPNFYCSPYPAPASARLPDLLLGHWHSEGFTSAVSTAKELQDAAPQPADEVAHHLAEVVAACRALVA
jgi:hypothetical protein